MKRILVATDGSDGADRAVDTAADLAAKLRLPLWIVSVTDGVSDVSPIARAEGVAVGDVLEAITDRILTDAKERSRKLGADDIRLQSRSGDCTTRILEIAEEIGADAIFVGRRGRGRLQGLLLGSISQKLATLAPCLVAIVP